MQNNDPSTAESAAQCAIERALSLSCWEGAKNAEPLDGGITNINVRVTDERGDWVVRLGDDILHHGVMRFNELAISQAAHAAGISPQVLHHEPGVLVLRFIASETLTEEGVRNPENLPSIIELIRRCHTEIPTHLRGPVLTFWVFHVIRDYVGLLRERKSRWLPRLDELSQSAARLERSVGAVQLVLGHNDLLAANVLRTRERLWLIDWEYGGYNSPLFDLGGLATNNGLSERQETEMLHQYFDRPPSAELIHSYTAMKCASLLRETMWSMVSEITSSLDFDYASYTRENLARFESAYAEYLES